MNLSPQRRKLGRALLASFVMLAIIFPAINLKAASGTPAIISYQGRLADSSDNLLGGSGTTYYFKFSIWNNATVGSGNKLWPPGTPGTTTATVKQGAAAPRHLLLARQLQLEIPL